MLLSQTRECRSTTVRLQRSIAVNHYFAFLFFIHNRRMRYNAYVISDVWQTKNHKKCHTSDKLKTKHIEILAMFWTIPWKQGFYKKQRKGAQFRMRVYNCSSTYENDSLFPFDGKRKSSNPSKALDYSKAVKRPLDIIAQDTTLCDVTRKKDDSPTVRRAVTTKN